MIKQWVPGPARRSGSRPSRSRPPAAGPAGARRTAIRARRSSGRPDPLDSGRIDRTAGHPDGAGRSPASLAIDAMISRPRFTALLTARLHPAAPSPFDRPGEVIGVRLAPGSAYPRDSPTATPPLTASASNDILNSDVSSAAVLEIPIV